jgi:hypothetical protein
MTAESHDHREMTDAEREREVREQLKQFRVADLAFEMMVSLVTIGYQKLGLTEQTRELRDLDDAHLAIELLRATLDVAERERDAEAFSDLRGTLAQMQLGYVQSLRLAESAGRTVTHEAPAEPVAAEPAGPEPDRDEPTASV